MREISIDVSIITYKSYKKSRETRTYGVGNWSSLFTFQRKGLAMLPADSAIFAHLKKVRRSRCDVEVSLIRAAWLYSHVHQQVLHEQLSCRNSDCDESSFVDAVHPSPQVVGSFNVQCV